MQRTRVPLTTASARNGRNHFSGSSTLAMWRALAYAGAGPNTVLGLCGAALAFKGGSLSVVGGVLEAHGPALCWLLTRIRPFGGAIAAITLGHVVLAADAMTLEHTRAHERVHVMQYERWGPLFIPAYLAAGLWAFMRDRHPYFDNRFEVEAYKIAR